MRVSIDRHDPGYVNVHLAPRVRVTLDGVTAEDVVTADEELGMIVQYVHDDNGRLVFDCDTIVRQERFGTVKILMSVVEPEGGAR